MSDIRQETVATYNKSAVKLAEYFRGLGSRLVDINLARKIVKYPENPRILEIGCGDGRDAKEIVKVSGWYKGFDISEKLIELAKKHVPQADFEVGDAVTFDYPDNLDIVFAFASLLHLDKEEVKSVLGKVHTALKPGGLFYISLKFAPRYEETIKEDVYGKRIFYLYTPELISELAGDGYETVLVCRQTMAKTKWFEIGLQKPLEQPKD